MKFMIAINGICNFISPVVN